MNRPTSALDSFFGAFGVKRTDAEADSATADEPAVDVAADAVAAAAAVAVETRPTASEQREAPSVAPAPARAPLGPATPLTDRYLATTLSEARREIEEKTARIEDLETQLRTTLERLGRRTTEVRNLESRVKVLDPIVEQVRQRDHWLDEARKETRKSQTDLDYEADRRKSIESDITALRKEIDWRDYVIRDMEKLPEQLREREAMILRLRKDHVAALAERDAEISRLRARTDELSRTAASA
ncbi:MAG: hypothetical protein K8T90_02290 [Planctomycetes bacterium]|nr:hypothetical protein [Planctomycetota bacterium]